ncbi:DUF418 domain-containing protein [Neorhizobium sp. T25_27]|uniref:DUF418 domain-containing protein n=1 Tax=Neorhizobium sp. T25_27 TaxID=2093831 RepID=UPI000CF8A73D|nr:DUF418 domain-containing protein [Neorhizobium sp. T25_27]
MVLRPAVQQRLTNIDALRGFSLFGILVVNISVFASTFYGSGAPDPAFSSQFDRLVQGFVALFFETKFYLLFSFLFGYSFTLQMRSAERAGQVFVPRMVRRQLGLLVIGVAHAVLLFHGDILSTYALLGIALLAMRHQSPRRMLKTAGWLIIVTASIWIFLGSLQLLEGGIGDVEQASIRAEAARATYTGSPAGVIWQHMRELPQMGLVLVLMQGPCALAMFLIGFVAGEKRIFERLEDHQPMLRRFVLAGSVVGLTGASVFAVATVWLAGSGWEPLGLGIGLLTAPLLSGAYVVVAMKVFRSRIGDWITGCLAPAGRMALTNYLFQSLACSLIFTAYGLGLVGEIAPAWTVALALVIFAVQLFLSHMWMRVFAYGPLEWVLRALTTASWPAWHV